MRYPSKLSYLNLASKFFFQPYPKSCHFFVSFTLSFSKGVKCQLTSPTKLCLCSTIVKTEMFTIKIVFCSMYWNQQRQCSVRVLTCKSLSVLKEFPNRKTSSSRGALFKKEALLLLLLWNMNLYFWSFFFSQSDMYAHRPRFVLLCKCLQVLSLFPHFISTLLYNRWKMKCWIKTSLNIFVKGKHSCIRISMFVRPANFILKMRGREKICRDQTLEKLL